MRRGRVLATWTDEAAISVKAPRFVWAETDPAVVAEAAADAAVSERIRPEDATGRGVVVGIIDWGCDFAHPNLRQTDGSTRLLGMWDQSNNTHPQKPAPYGYGATYTADAINRALLDARPYAALGYHPGDSDPLGDGAHGTHVCDIAAGNGRLPGSPVGVAPQADIVFVHLAASRGGERVSLGDTSRILEALHWIAVMAGDRPFVVNLSVGRCAGPHHGLLLVEQGIDQLLLMGPGRCVVHSTGNYFATRGHTAGRLRPGESHTIGWETERADVTPNELEVWYPGRDRFLIELRAPGSDTVIRVSRGDHAKVEVGGRDVGHVYHRASDPSNGDHHIDIFLDPAAPAGTWQVVLVAEDVVDGRFHVWIERDAVCASCQSHLASGDVVPLSTTGTICNGFRSIAVGAYDARRSEPALARFSSAGPTRDGRQKPDLIAPGVGIIAARSTPPGTDIPTAFVAEKSGTSMAAPHVTGTVACMFEAAGRPLWIHETRAFLFGSAAPVSVRPEDGPRVGSGVLDPQAAVAAVRASFAPLAVPVSSVHESPSETAIESEVAMASPEIVESMESLEDVEAACGAVETTPQVVEAREIEGVADVFDALVFRRGPKTARAVKNLDVVAYPGAPLRENLRPGDILLRRPLAEGAIAHAGHLVSGETLNADDAVARGWTPERAIGGRYATVTQSGPFGHESAERFARRVTDGAGRLPHDQMIVRRRLSGEAAVDAEEARNLVRVPADAYPPDGYSRFQVRADLADSYRAMYRQVRALGGMVTSSGGMRDLSAQVTPGRSRTSLHYLGRAIDLYIRSGMQTVDDPYLVVRDGGSDNHPRWKIYCVSTAPHPDDPLYDPNLLQTAEFECAIWERHRGYRTVARTARCFCLTDVMAQHGWVRIPSRSDWRDNYLSLEWWHFQNEAGLEANRTRFGDELLRIWPADDVAASGLALDALWDGAGAFRAPAPRQHEQAGEEVGDGSPFVQQATASSWSRCQGFRNSPNAAGAAQILRESGVTVDANPYVGLTSQKLEAVIRAGFTATQLPETLLAIWAKEGSTRMVTTARQIAQAATPPNAQTIFRCRVYYEDLGSDHFIVTTRTPGGDNVWDSSDAAAPGHEAHFRAAVQRLVARGVLSEDISAAVNAELGVSRGPPYAVTPTTKFYALSLLLVDALFTEMRNNTFPQVTSLSESLNYMQWNMGTNSFRQFLVSADAHRREPQFSVGGQPIDVEQWALHTAPRANEYRQARINGIRFMHYLDSYRPIFQPSLNLIKPGIEDLALPRHTG